MISFLGQFNYQFFLGLLLLLGGRKIYYWVGVQIRFLGKSGWFLVLVSGKRKYRGTILDNEERFVERILFEVKLLGFYCQLKVFYVLIIQRFVVVRFFVVERKEGKLGFFVQEQVFFLEGEERDDSQQFYLELLKIRGFCFVKMFMCIVYILQFFRRCTCFVM